jgi:hypothetical protein
VRCCRKINVPALFAGALLVAVAACHSAPPKQPAQVIGLSTSLPLIWAEAGDIRGQLAAQAPAHWAMTMLAARGRVIALDTLSGRNGALPLPSDGLLVLAQPRPLMPEENVALDAWVRSGGRLLLFADPMLTAPSEFALGDPRGPQRVAMLSPILRHWGLDLQFDPAQPAGERDVDMAGVPLRVDVAGRFAATPASPCRLEAAGIVAECRIGRGRIIAVADAAVFDGDDAGRSAAWAALLARLQD